MERFERRPKARFTRLALLLTGSLAGCAAPLYLHSPSLEKATAKAATSLPDQATALKPFDDQLAALAAFATREDLAVAQYWTTVRDAHFTRLLSSTDAERESSLRRQVGARLQALAGGTINLEAPGNANAREDLRKRLAQIARLTVPGANNAIVTFVDLADSQRRHFRAAAPDDRRDLGCQAVLASTDEAERRRLASSSRASENALGQVAEICAGIAALSSLPGLLQGSAIQNALAAVNSREESLEQQNQHPDALQRAIADAERFSKSESSVAQLEAFRASLGTALADAGEAAKVTGLDAVLEHLESLQRTVICGSAAVEAATKATAGCDQQGNSASNARAQAVWAVASSLAQLADANAPERRSLEWLAAAKAIVAAQRADAQLSLARARDEVAAERQRIGAMTREAYSLTVAGRALLGGRAQCQDGRASNGSPNVHCAMAAYLESWNEGRVPSEVLTYRTIQLERADAVRRARVVAQREHVLATSGATMLGNYGAGGLRSESIVQVISNLALIGASLGD